MKGFIAMFATTAPPLQLPKKCAARHVLPAMQTISGAHALRCGGRVLLQILGLTFVVTLALLAQQRPGRFDLVAQQRDLNGLLLNPTWGDSTRSPLLLDPEEECGLLALHGTPGVRSVLLRDTTCFGSEQRKILRIDEPRSVRVGGFICGQPAEDGSVHGHLNWFPVTLTGTLHYEDYSNGEGGDYDVNFNLLSDSVWPASKWPVTRWNWKKKQDAPGLNRIHVELDYNETFYFLPPDPFTWWKRFGTLLRNSTRDSVDRFLGPVQATVTGLFNLDAVHHGHAELHPVFAMAILYHADTLPGGGEIHQHWALLARDRGNEGNCAFGQIPFRLGTPGAAMNEYRFLIPRPAGDTGAPRIQRSHSWIGSMRKSVLDSAFHWAPGQGLEMSVRWPAPHRDTAYALMMGDLEVRWYGSFGARPVTRGLGAEDSRAGKVRDESGSQLGPQNEDVTGTRQGARQPSGDGRRNFAEEREWSDALIHVDTLPHAGALGPAEAEIFDLTPPVVSCAQVSKNFNPRCAGEWSLVPAGAFRLHDAALDQRWLAWAFSIGWENQHTEILVHNLHFRPALFVAFRRAKDRSIGRTQSRVALQPGFAAGPWIRPVPLYLVVNPELVLTHDVSWDHVGVGVSGGAGFKLRHGYRVDVALEGLVVTTPGQGPFFVLGLRTPVVAPWQH